MEESVLDHPALPRKLHQLGGIGLLRAAAGHQIHALTLRDPRFDDFKQPRDPAHENRSRYIRIGYNRLAKSRQSACIRGKNTGQERPYSS
ncbi:hypothetical protein VDG1235_1808 [Verrucomicrobiia bacterium DG1235]|nr:hypothetical protein VDG1235_1808 [Verrucomicrobiae bacterium DG1235]